MKKIRISGRNKAAAWRLSRFGACFVLFAAICTPAAGVVAVNPETSGPQGSLPVHRQVADLSVDKTFNSVGFRTDRMGHGNDAVSGAVLLPDGKVLVGVHISIWNTTTQYFTGFEVIRINPDGTRDSTFDNRCTMEATSGNGYWPVESLQPMIAVQPDGKIVAVARTTPSSSNFTVMRCNPEGTRDATFGVGGTLQRNFSFNVVAFAAQADGKIVVGGSGRGVGAGFRLGRVNVDGTTDTTFDGDGAVTVELSNPEIRSIAIQPDGKIIAAGASSGDFAVVRLNSDGSPDTTFDGDGKLTTPIHSNTETANTVVLQPDGKILAAGTSLNSTTSTSGVFALVRYNADGSLDTTFDGDGKVVTPIVNAGTVLLASNIRTVAVQQDGKILAAGITHNGQTFDDVFVRYNADGSVDSSFGVGGLVVPPIPTVADYLEESADVLLIRPDGRILSVGDTINWRGGKDITLRQFNTDGSTDNSFGSVGKSHFDVGKQRTSATAVAVQPDGTILVAGSMPTGVMVNQQVYLIARYHADGSSDTTFGNGGYILQNEAITKLAIGPGGKIAAGGVATSTATFVRYNGDGTIDTTFDTDGKVTISVSQSDGIEAMEFQPDGKLLFLNNTSIRRFTIGGTLDTSFDGDGRADPNINSAIFKLQSDGKIVSAGVSGNDFGVTRTNPDGTPDTSFDGDGLAVTSTSAGADIALSLSLQPDGKIVAVGRSNCCNGINTTFVRYNTNGSVDTTFGTSGITVMPNALAIDDSYIRPDGKILAVSHFSQSLSFVRLTPNGLPDTSFYGDGATVFNNTKYGTSPVPTTGQIAFSADGTMINAGSDGNATGVNSDRRTLFVSRIKLLDHPYVYFDHSGDGRADLAVFRPSNNTWYVLTPDRFTATELGQAGDRPVPADYDGDGITDLATYRPSNGLWTMLNSETQTQSTRSMISNIPMPMPSDRDGDGHDDVSIVGNALSNQLASVMVFSESNSLFQQIFGLQGDLAVRGDFDGNGRADIAVYRPSNQTWYFLSSSHSGGFYAVNWGAAGDVPVPADYDGDGKTDIAVWRPSTGQWWIQGSTAGLMNSTVWGEPTDKAVPADYDGDGKTDIAVWRPSTGTWYIINSSNSSIRAQHFGQDGDVPLPGAFIY